MSEPSPRTLKAIMAYQEGQEGGEGGGKGGGLGGGAQRVPINFEAMSPDPDQDQDGRAGGDVYSTPQQPRMLGVGVGHRGPGEGKADDDFNGAPIMVKGPSSKVKGQKIGKVFSIGTCKATEQYFSPPKVMHFGRNLQTLARQVLEELVGNPGMWISVCEGIIQIGMPWVRGTQQSKCKDLQEQLTELAMQ